MITCIQMTCSCCCCAGCHKPLPRGPYKACNTDCGGCGTDYENYFPICTPILGNIGRCDEDITPPPRPPGAIPTLTLILTLTLATRCRPSGIPSSLTAARHSVLVYRIHTAACGKGLHHKPQTATDPCKLCMQRDHGAWQLLAELERCMS